MSGFELCFSRGRYECQWFRALAGGTGRVGARGMPEAGAGDFVSDFRELSGHAKHIRVLRTHDLSRLFEGVHE